MSRSPCSYRIGNHRVDRYRRHRPLSTEQEAQLGVFMALRTLQDLLWVLTEREQPAFRDRWPTQMRTALQSLEAFIQS